MKKDKITVEAQIHWKEGDEFAGLLKEYSTPKALELWGKSLIEKGQTLIKASEILAGQDNIKGWGGTRDLSLSNIDRERAEKLFKLGMFHQNHFEKEHESCEGCEECYGLDFTPVEGFMDVISGMKDEIYYSVFTTEEPKGKKRIALYYPSAYSSWKNYMIHTFEDYDGLSADNLIGQDALLIQIREEPYFIKDKVIKMISGRPMGCIILSLDPEDDPSHSLLSFRLEEK